VEKALYREENEPMTQHEMSITHPKSPNITKIKQENAEGAMSTEDMEAQELQNFVARPMPKDLFEQPIANP